jgi:hypothetical protein
VGPYSLFKLREGGWAGVDEVRHRFANSEHKARGGAAVLVFGALRDSGEG